MIRRLLRIVVLFLFASCGNTSDKRKQAKENIGHFATLYFNYDFSGAMDYCTYESRKWISMIASNVTEADLDILRAQTDGAEAEVIAIFFGQDDTTAVATVHVANIMLTDTIGRPGHMVEEAEYSIPAVFRSDRWLVKMACPLRSGK